METTETAGNPILTQGEHEEWVTETLRRIGANLNDIEVCIHERLDTIDKQISHLDNLTHEVHQAVAPLRDHPDALTRAVSMLDRTPAWLGRKKPQ